MASTSDRINSEDIHFSCVLAHLKSRFFFSVIYVTNFSGITSVGHGQNKEKISYSLLCVEAMRERLPSFGFANLTLG